MNAWGQGSWTTWTHGKTGWAVMLEDGQYITQSLPGMVGTSYDTADARVMARATAWDLARKVGGQLVKLVSTAQWDSQYNAVSVASSKPSKARKPASRVAAKSTGRKLA